MTPGKLYTYSSPRGVYSDYKCISRIEDLKFNEPFLFLGEKVELKWVQSYKILTSKGIVGWIQVGYPESIKVFGEANG